MNLYLKRVIKAIKLPYKLIFSKLNPVGYAKSIGVNIGNNVKIYGSSNEMFSTEPWIVHIGNDCHITKDVLFLTHDGGTLIFEKHEIQDFILTGKIVVGNNSYIGTRTIILPGVTIGDNCIIGAGSIVSKDIPDNSVAVGTPARVVNTKDGYLNKIKDIMSGNLPQYYESLEAVRSLNPKTTKKIL